MELKHSDTNAWGFHHTRFVKDLSSLFLQANELQCLEESVQAVLPLQAEKLFLKFES